MTDEDPFAILGLSPDASPGDVEAARRRLSDQYSEARFEGASPADREQADLARRRIEQAHREILRRRLEEGPAAPLEHQRRRAMVLYGAAAIVVVAAVSAYLLKALFHVPVLFWLTLGLGILGASLVALGTLLGGKPARQALSYLASPAEAAQDSPSVRDASREEYEEVENIWREAFSSYTDALLDEETPAWKEALSVRANRAGRARIVALEVKGRLVGALVYQPPTATSRTGRASPVSAQAAFIDLVAVRPPFQRQGFGAILLLEGLLRASEDGAKEAGLVVAEQMAEGRRLAEAFGFRRGAATRAFGTNWWGYELSASEYPRPNE